LTFLALWQVNTANSHKSFIQSLLLYTNMAIDEDEKELPQEEELVGETEAVDEEEKDNVEQKEN
jgi:hypothetical protein